jgi:hypothetical protein
MAISQIPSAGISSVSATTVSSGTLPFAQLPTGSVLQVVNVTNTTNFSTSSVSAVSTGITASITPKYSTSKILVLCSLASGSNTGLGTGSGSVTFALYRGGSQVGQAGNCGGREQAGRTGNFFFNIFLSVLDSPATTSSVTYTLYGGTFADTTVTAYLNQQGNGTGTTFTLMEIAG